jgi:hypothetical protein
MDKEQIIQWAREAGGQFDHMTWVERDLAPVFQRFAKLVRDDYSNKHAQLWLKRIDEAVKAEREAIAADADWCIQNNLEHLIPERIRARK